MISLQISSQIKCLKLSAEPKCFWKTKLVIKSWTTLYVVVQRDLNYCGIFFIFYLEIVSLLMVTIITAELFIVGIKGKWG